MVGATGAYARASKGFMGKEWDGGDVAFRPETWRAVYDKLKPGAMLAAFSGSRTHHRMGCAIEDAGFEIRDTVFYCYGSGFPKSHNINKSAAEQICQCAEKTGAPTLRQRDLRPLQYSDLPQAECFEAQCGEVLHDGLQEQGAPSAGWSEFAGDARAKEPSLEGRGNLSEAPRELCFGEVCEVPPGTGEHGASGRLCDGASPSDGALGRAGTDANGVRSPRRSQAAEQSSEQPGIVAGQSESQTGGAWALCERCGKPNIPAGLGTALKPALEVIYLARKPLSEKNIAANVLKHGTGAINVDGCRIPGEKPQVIQGINSNASSFNVAKVRQLSGDPHEGRWPANILHDGSDEVLAGFPVQSSGGFPANHGPKESGRLGKFNGVATGNEGAHKSEGSAARFFYSAKAGPLDRIGSKHPTIKPVDLMRWLVRLVTPPGGHILEPFAGSGSTGIAALAEGFDCTMIDLEADHVADIERKLAFLRGEGRMRVEEHLNGREHAKPSAVDLFNREQAA